MKLKVFSVILLFSISVFGQDTIKFNVLIDDKSIDDKKNQSFNKDIFEARINGLSNFFQKQIT